MPLSAYDIHKMFPVPKERPKSFFDIAKEFGGEGSGNFGHEGRPGEVGGSGEGGGSNGLSAESHALLREVDADPQVLEARRQNKAPSTAEQNQIAKNVYTPERKALHREIVGTLLNPRAASKAGEQPRVIMLLGLPASGKSKVLRAGIEGEYTTIDADEIKKHLPEYNKQNAGIVHSESAHIAEKFLLPKAIKDRHNIIVDWTGKNADKTMKFINKWKDKGYRVEVRYVKISAHEAAKRAYERFKDRSDGRFVDPSYILREMGDRPQKTFERIKKSGIVNHYIAYDNEVPRGQKPKLIESKGM